MDLTRKPEKVDTAMSTDTIVNTRREEDMKKEQEHIPEKVDTAMRSACQNDSKYSAKTETVSVDQ
jgi:hypothetical protein